MKRRIDRKAWIPLESTVSHRYSVNWTNIFIDHLDHIRAGWSSARVRFAVISPWKISHGDVRDPYARGTMKSKRTEAWTS